MASPQSQTHRSGAAARTGAAGTVVATFAFFDGAVVGTPVALLAASLRPSLVFVGAALAVSVLSIGCCTWTNRRWDDWFAGNDTRIGRRLGAMRESRLMRRPVAWIEHGSDRRYALASAVVNPVLVVALARSAGAATIPHARIRLGSVAYAIPYVAMWTLIGLGLGGAIRAA
ncbi:MAG TPA: hypothetical protein VMJ49_02640 [Gaiellaceae bacterium]|nr:hypothetical protein [Gaiellaceae bacterium]